MSGYNLDIKDYTYELPDERIAKYPLENRSQSKLLYYNSGVIKHETFSELNDIISDSTQFVFNNTKVLPARMRFEKETGAQIEIFLTDPIAPQTDFQLAINAKSPVIWKCIVGNSKRWKDGQVLSAAWNGSNVTARWVKRQELLVEIQWDEDISFIDLLKQGGEMPLPPYMNRRAEEDDKERYQTVYAKKQGAVAAPTAGLHFNDQMVDELKRKGKTTEVTLHVSAGTFRPIMDSDVLNHEMHREFIQVNRSAIEQLMENEDILSVGTTSLRTLESLYWYGVRLLSGETDFFIPKLYPYQNVDRPSRKKSLKAVLDFMDDNGLATISGETEIFIIPGYTFMVAKKLITNFHLPGSTLILLVAAFVGDDWQRIYESALENGYRFLSYGDSSLLIPKS